MFRLFGRLFKRLRGWWKSNPQYLSLYEFDSCEVQYIVHAGRTWMRMPNVSLFMGQGPKAYDYWCPTCDAKLCAGPEGGLSVNAVCRVCNVNWGCLPDYYG